MYVFTANDESGTERLGAVLANILPPGTVVALLGTLGAGKTRLVQAVAAALGVPPNAVTSPTFVLVHQYNQGRLPIYHFDAYRIGDDDEFQELGPDEYFEADGLTFIEWADRVINGLPENHLSISIEIISPTERKFIITAAAKGAQALAKKIAVRLTV